MENFKLYSIREQKFPFPFSPPYIPLLVKPISYKFYHCYKFSTMDVYYCLISFF